MISRANLLPRCACLVWLSVMLFCIGGLAARPQPSNQASGLGSASIADELRRAIREGIPGLPFQEDHQRWLADAPKLRKRILNEVVLKGVPRAWAEGMPKVEWLDTISTDWGYRIRKLRYEAVPGLWVPALLYEPDHLKGRVPAVLNVNGHVGAPGKATPYEQIRCINLAKRGMIALHPEWLACGELSSPEYRHNRLAYLDAAGVRGVSVFYLLMKRGLDILDQHPNADRKRLAMTGLSGGGWQTILLSALDTRIAASAPNAGYIGLSERVINPGDIGDLEQNPAGLQTLADYTHLTALLAPRHTLLIYNERDDCCFASPRARASVYEPIKALFEAAGARDRLSFHSNLDPGNHNYERDNRQQFYRFLNRAFKLPNPRDDEIPSEKEVKTFEELKCGIPADNATFASLATEFLAYQSAKEAGAKRLREILIPPQLEDVEVTESNRNAEGAPVPSVTGTMRVGGKFTLPYTILGGHSQAVRTLVVADGGRNSLGKLADTLVARYGPIRVVDPAAIGEALPRVGIGKGQWAMMLGSTGRPLLGIQAAQLAAIIDFMQPSRTQVQLVGVGRISSVIALCAASLTQHPVAGMELRDPLLSFRDLIDQRVEYDAAPELFVPGMARAFDVPSLLRLTRCPSIRLFIPSGSRLRFEAEFSGMLQSKAGRAAIKIVPLSP